MDFQSADTLILRPSDELRKEGHFAMGGRASPLDFLAQASIETQSSSRWSTTLSDGREKITVVPGPSGISIKLHKGNGRLPPIDLSKPFAKKCRNRECNNLGGQPGKPRSIYCSKRCQSREQNLRQGRIKNVRSPPTVGATPSVNPTPLASSSTAPPARSRSESPRSDSENMNDIHSDSPSPELDAVSPNISPTPFVPSPIPFVPSSAPPTHAVLSTPSPIPLPNNVVPTNVPPTHILAPSPLNVRLGMTPSPIPMSPSPISMSNSRSSFSPVPMSAAISPASHISTPMFLHRPAAVVPTFATPTPPTFATPTPPTNPKTVAFQSNTFSPPTSNPSPRISPVTTEEKKERESLTLAPILS